MKILLVSISLIFLTNCTYFTQKSATSKTINGMQFSSLRLSNDLEVLLVHDARFKKSAAALAVSVGSMEDPKSSLGMAHYLEHMLFLGTKEFPDSGEYSAYMEANGGWDNAYTSDEITNYMFEVDNGAFQGGLERFSRFFVSPLFDTKYIDREKNAVHNEFEKNIKQDNWRVRSFIKTLVKKDHPSGQFSIGNNKSLDKTSREEVIQFYRKYYSANNMKLVVMSAQPMSDLETWSRKYFADIPNFKADRPKYAELPLETTGPRLHFVKTIKDVQTMKLIFNVPDDTPHWKTKPLSIIGRLLGDEGKGSLLSYLKNKGWALGLNSGSSFWRTFGVDILLTPEGREHYQDVIAAVFSYIDLMNRRGYDRYLFEDEKSLRRIDFENLEPLASGDRAAWFSAEMVDHPVDEFLQRNFLLEEYSVEDFKKFLSFLKSDNVHIIIGGKNEKTDKTESAFGVEYSSAAPQILTAHLEKELFYPEKSKYIPNNFSLIGKEKKMGDPQKIDLSGRGVLFSRLDTELGLAKAHLAVNIISHVENSVKNHLLSSLFVMSKNEELREWAYPISEARYNFDVGNSYGDEINIMASGYTQSLKTVVKDLVADAPNGRRIDEVKIDEATFLSLRAKHKRDLQNILENVASQRLQQELSQISDDKSHPWREQLNLVDSITLKDVQSFGKLFFQKISIEGVDYGNVDSGEFVALVDYIYSSLGSQTLPMSEVSAKDRKFRRVPDGKTYSMLVKGNNNNHAMLSVYKLAPWSLDAHIRALVVDQMISRPFFHELRTQQQLGYVASSSVTPSMGYIALYAVIQSSKFPSKELFERSNKFLVEFIAQKSLNFSAEEFKPIKESLMNELQKKPTTLYERYADFSRAALRYDGRFQLREELAQRLSNLSPEDIKAFLREAPIAKDPSLLVLYYSGQGSSLSKAQLPKPAFEKVSEIKDWTLESPYKQR